MTAIMERPYKRRRFSDPPELELHHRRERNDLRLKSTFESIFEKYGKDFGGIGDEIDLETGEIVVNNGHILGMANERDAGDHETDSEEYESEDWSDDEGMLASSLLLETRRRIGLLGREDLQRRMNFTGEGLPSEDDADSLMGDSDSLMGGAESQPILPAMRMSTFAPDNLYDDETEDELASGEMEWPTPRKAWPTPNMATPRKAWPTPKTATPLSHTPWHSSPLKPVYNSDNSRIDPAWKAPPLPRGDELRGFESSTGSPKGHKAKDLQLDRSIRKRLPRVSRPHTPRRRPSMSNPLDHMRTLDCQEKSYDKRSAAGLRSVPNMGLLRWTKSEENLLRRLRTSTRLMYSEIQPFLPGRKTEAIRIHWSKMTRRVTTPRPSYNSPSSGSTVFSSAQNTSLEHESNGSLEMTGRKIPFSYTAAPAPKDTLNGSMEHLVSADPNLILRAGSSPEIKLQTTSPSCERDIPNSSDPTDDLQGIQSSPLLKCARLQATPTESQSKALPTLDIREEQHGEQAIVGTVSAPEVGSTSAPVNTLSQNVNEGLQSSPRCICNGQSRLEQPKSISSKSFHTSRSTSNAKLSTGQISDSQQKHLSASKGAVFLPSYLSDFSDDELSSPVKTLGLYRAQNRRASSPKL